MKYFLMLIGLLILIFIIYQMVRIHKLIEISKKLVQETKPYSITPSQPTSRVLFMGDSLGVGVGASSPQKSIAGLFSQDHPQSEVQNVSVSGAKIHDVLLVAKSFKPGDIFDTIFIQIGANDIVHLTSLRSATTDLEALLPLAQAHAKKVVFYTAGNVGSVPLMPTPVNLFYRVRSNVFFSRFQEIAQKYNVTYVPLFYPWNNDPLLKNPALYFAADSYHVSDTAYALWYEKIKEALK